ncbi:MAG: NADPH-dependent F420 reductase [Mycetocola sp.]
MDVGVAPSATTIGFLGAGKVGLVLARHAVAAGFRVLVASSRPPERMSLTVGVLAPGAQAVTAEQAAAEADIVVLAAPLGKFMTLPSASIGDALVIDAMNYWWEVDGAHPELNDPLTSSSETVRDGLGLNRYVKAFNHLGYHDLDSRSRNDGGPGRVAIALAGDDRADVALAGSLVHALGFDAVDIGALANGVILEPGSELFGATVSAEELAEAVRRFPSTERDRHVVEERRAAGVALPSSQIEAILSDHVSGMPAAAAVERSPRTASPDTARSRTVSPDATASRSHSPRVVDSAAVPTRPAGSGTVSDVS